MTRATLIVSFIICAVSWASAQVRVWQGTLTPATYEEGVHDLAFTHDGLEPLLRSARVNYLLGHLYQSCRLNEKAQARFKGATGQSSFEGAVWAWKASQQMPGFQSDSAQQKLEGILQRSRNTAELSSRTGWWLYSAALLNRATGHTDLAESEFRQAFLHPDQMLTYHLVRLALAEGKP